MNITLKSNQMNQPLKLSKMSFSHLGKLIKKLFFNKLIRFSLPGMLVFIVPTLAAQTVSAPNSSKIAAIAGSTTAASNYIGINIANPSDFAEDRPFANAFRSARNWRKGSDENNPILANTDVNGWPTEDASLYVLTLNNSDGTYKLSFDGGVNSIVTLHGVTGSITNRTVSGSVISYDVIITSPSNTLAMSFTNTGGGVRNVKLMRPITKGSTQSYASNVEFTDQVKNLIAKFQCIRFMDWTSTNWNNDANWSARVSDTYYWGSLSTVGYGWQGRGASWESAIRLANETGKDAWICVPAKATDDYITQLATLWKNNLNPSLKLYVEYGNEIWNPTFTALNQVRDYTNVEVEAGNSSLNFDGIPVTGNPLTEDWTFAQRGYGKRVAKMSTIFRTVFGDAAMMTQVRPVLQWQQPTGVNSFLAIEYIDKILGTVNQWNAVAHPVNYYIWGGGGSAYYNPDNLSDALTIDNIWTSETYDINTWKSACQSEINLCAAYGVKRVAYEGGPSMDNHGHSEAIKAQAWSDPRIKTCLSDHHTLWNQYGGDLLNYFCSTNGSTDYQFAFAQNIFDLNTQKLQAIDQINNSTREAVTYGIAVPATIDAYSTSITGGNVYGGGTGNLGLRTGSTVYGNGWCAYTLNVTTPGLYSVSFKVNSGWSYTGSVNIYCDGVLLGTEAVNSPGQTSGAYSVNLSAGIHSVRFYNVSNAEISLAQIIINSLVPDTAVPSTPTGLNVAATSRYSVALNWNASVNALGTTTYDVYKDGVLVAGSNTTNTSYTVTGLNSSTSYSFTVIAKDGFGSAAPTAAVTAQTLAAAAKTYRYLKLTAIAPTGSLDVWYNEIEWMDGASSYPNPKLTGSSPLVTSPAPAGEWGAADWKAFDGNLTSGYVLPGAISTTYPYAIIIDLGAGNGIYPTAIKIAIAYVGRSLSAFQCDGSNDKSTWTNLLTVTGKVESDWVGDAVNSFTIPEPVITSAATLDKWSVTTYPNPVSDQLHLNFGSQVDHAEISILDFQGRIIITKSLANTQMETLHISNMTNGIYFVKVVADGKVMNSKFVKK